MRHPSAVFLIDVPETLHQQVGVMHAHAAAVADDQRGIPARRRHADLLSLEHLADAVDEDSEVISIYNGADVSEDDAQKLAGRVEEAYPDVDVQCYYGGQPIYYYIVSVE